MSYTPIHMHTYVYVHLASAQIVSVRSAISQSVSHWLSRIAVSASMSNCELTPKLLIFLNTHIHTYIHICIYVFIIMYVLLSFQYASTHKYISIFVYVCAYTIYVYAVRWSSKRCTWSHTWSLQRLIKYKQIHLK